MFTQRWSTLTLLSFSVFAAVLGFCGGKHTLTAISLSAISGERDTIKISSRPLKAVESKPEPSVTGAQGYEELCRRLMGQPASPDRDEELCDAMEKLAEQNPQCAIALAKNELNARLRCKLLKAAFRGWGKTDAVAAAGWILSQTENSLDPNEAIASVLQGAVQNPEKAIELTQWLDQKNPGQARDYGDALIYALGQEGNFQLAANFAISGEGDLRVEWVAAAFGNWANYQPQDAAAGALQMTDPDARRAALDAVISDWGQINPKALADFAMGNLPEGDQKTRALANALIYWAGNDAVDAANWVNTFGPAPELDQGEAAIATQQDVMKQPDVALRWAEVITDSNLRSRTIAAIVQTWSLSNPSAALDFLNASADLLPADRTDLLARMSAQSN